MGSHHFGLKSSSRADCQPAQRSSSRDGANSPLFG